MQLSFDFPEEPKLTDRFVAGVKAASGRAEYFDAACREPKDLGNWMKLPFRAV
jgi:hypothetical protein